MNAVDTNILLYVHDPRDPDKQARAATLVRSLTDGVLLWQVACEYLAASRKLEPFGYNRAQAGEDIRDLRRTWTTILPGWDLLQRAEDLLARFNLSFWDSLIVAACHEGNLTKLYSEDFGPYPRIDALEIVNPFIG